MRRLMFLIMALPVLGLAAPAHAALINGTAKITPVTGSTVPDYFTGPVKVDFTNAALQQYAVAAKCGDKAVLYKVVTPTSTQRVFSWPTAPAPGGTTCTVTVNETKAWASVGKSTFTVAAPATTDPLAFTTPSVTPATFYPLVTEGYRDTTTVAWSNNRAADTAVEVWNSAGSRVRYAPLGIQTNGAHTWTWDGRLADGTQAPAGGYGVRIVGKDSAGNQAKASASTTIAQGSTTVPTSLTLGGDKGWVGSAGSCSGTLDTTAHTTALACTGTTAGSWARAAYTFKLPSNATDVSGAVTWTAAGTDDPATGTATYGVTKIDATTWRVVATVTGKRAFTISSAQISYLLTPDA